MSQSGVIAIDGPVASGKSSVALLLAERLGAVMLDTGMFYRALAWLAWRFNLDRNDGNALAAAISRIQLVPTPLAGASAISCRAYVDGADVTDELSSPEVEGIVSAVARHPAVRAGLLEAQRAAVSGQLAVAAGRDMGTQVFPDALLKVFLVATAEVRAKRRAAQRAGGAADQEGQVLGAILDRDEADAKQMVRAPDAVVVETGHLTLEQVVDEIHRLLKVRIGADQAV